MIKEEVLPEGPKGNSGFDRENSRENLIAKLGDLQKDVHFLIHEIRTPLTAVASSAQYLQESNFSSEECRHWLAAIRNEALRINSLLEDFTCFQSSRTWLSSINFSVVHIPELLRETSRLFRDASLKHLIRVTVPPGLQPVRGDRKKLELVLRNLVANALKYSPDGGMIVISAEKHNRRIVIRVRDEGLGIPPESLEAIFERSFRVDRPESRKMRGTGLGLAMVRQIVENHGGRVWVKSAPGKGSTFSISLPMSD